MILKALKNTCSIIGSSWKFEILFIHTYSTKTATVEL